MIRALYSQWDGTRAIYSLEAERALDELSKFLMEGLELEKALDWMRHAGFDLAGMDFRVMGMEELLQELRQQANELMSGVNMDETFDDRWQQLNDLLELEGATQERENGIESSQWNDFRTRLDRMPRRLSEALENFRDHEWADADAEEAFQELLGDAEDISALEEFYARNKSRMQGPDGLDYEQALDLMRQVEAIAQLAQDLLDGNFENLSPDELRERLGEAGFQSIMILRDLEGTLDRAGYLRKGEAGLELTPRAIRRLGELALEDIYSTLKRGAAGSHETKHRGAGVVATERSRKYVFGEPAHLDAVGTLRNALRRGPASRDPISGRTALELGPDDLEVYDTDQLTETTTVLLLDMSWSMSWSGRWPAAKRVAVAMNHLIRTRYPRDHFFIVGFYTRARELTVRELPELSWNMTDPFTNLQDGLRVAQRLIGRHPSPNCQIIVITDGQPTAYFVGSELRVEWPNGYGGVSPRAIRETLREVARVTRKGITINTFMLDSAPELLRFVEQMTRINRGRAFYTTPDSIGEYIMVDYLTHKRRRIS
jgi:uncharacterized protein with von Willebrand factor type A (vWA) domain